MTLAERLIDKGMQKGRESGLKEGLAEGLASGVEKGKNEMLWKQMIKKFPNLPSIYLEKLKQLDVARLDLLALELLDMQKQEDLDRYLQT
jgi:flagellar biosynthesis/type III secretory pathway protein FliH